MLQLYFNEIKYHKMSYLSALLIPVLFNAGLIFFTPFAQEYEKLKFFQNIWLGISFVAIAAVYQRNRREKRNIAWNLFQK